MKLLDSNLTDPTAGEHLSPGSWLFELSTTDTAASITVEFSRDGGTVWMPAIDENGSAAVLTPTAPQAPVPSSGSRYRVTNSSGAGVATVWASKRDGSYA